MKDYVRGLSAAVLWTASVALMIVGTMRASEYVMGWGLFVALVACIVCGWLIADCATYRERIRVENIVSAVINRLQQEKGVPRI